MKTREISERNSTKMTDETTLMVGHYDQGWIDQ